MRIGLFTDTYPPQINGVANSTYILRNELVKAGHEVFVITTNAEKSESVWNEEHDVLYLGGIELKFLYGYIMTTPFHLNHINDIRELDLDVIHIQTEFGVGIFGHICARQLSIPLVATYHTTWEDYTHYVNFAHLKSIDNVAKKAVKELSRIHGDSVIRLIAPSKKTKELLERYNVKTKIEIIPTGLELDHFSPDHTDFGKREELRKNYNVQAGEKLLVYVGRLAQEKSLDLVIAGMQKVSEEGIPVKLLIVGGGPDMHVLEKEVREAHLEDKVFLTGPKPGDEVPDIYRSCDAFVSASLSETQGMTFIEALASGLPLFARKDEVLEELLIPEQTGWFFETPEDFAERLKEFTKLDDARMQDLKTACIAHARPYSSRHFGQEVLRVYQDALTEYDGLYSIEDISVKDNTVRLFLVTKSHKELRLSMTMDDYYTLGLRRNETLTNVLLDKLKEKEEGVIAYQKCLKRISVKDRTRKEIYDWLTQNTKCDIEKINSIIEKLELKGYINDSRYCDEYIARMTGSLFGKEKIIRDLRRKGISNELIMEKLENRSDRDEDAMEYAERVLESSKDESLLHLKGKIKTKLLQRGFSSDTADEVIGKLDFSRPDSRELENLKTVAHKAKRRYERKYTESDLRNHIYRYCAAKGFKGEDIYAVLDEMEWEDEED